MNEQACAHPRNATADANGALSLPVAWAAGCGLLAGGPATLSGLGWLRVLAAWLVADVLLGSVSAQLAALKAHEAAPPVALDGAPQRGWLLPYAEAGTHAVRLRAWWDRHAVQRAWAPAVGLALAAAVLALVVTTLLGPWPLLVTAVALVSIALGAVLTRDPRATSDLGRGLQAAAGWLLIRVLAAPWQRWAWLPALCAGAWVWAQHGMLRGVRSAPWLARAASAAAVALLLLQRQPLPATAVALAALGAEWALERGVVTRPFVLQAPWLASALLLALTARYWG